MKKIAVIGASYLQLPLVKKAKEMGLEVHCFAWEEGAVCKTIADYFYPLSILEKEAILTICQDVQIDAITTIASDTTVLTVNYVAEKMGLVSNEDAYSAITTNKYLMRQCFTENGIPSPRYAQSRGEVPASINSFEYPLIVKPTDRSGSRGVEKVYAPGDVQQAITNACAESFQKEAIIEEYIGGREISVESLSYQGEHHILQVTDKVTTGEPHFVELEHHQPSTITGDLRDKVQEVVCRALTALHIKYGAAHSELKITDEGTIKVIEIGARMGGDFIGSDLVRLSTGYDFLEGVIQVALGHFTPPRQTIHRHAGVYFLSQETAWVKPIIENHNAYPEIVEAAITDTVLRPLTSSGERSGYFIYQADQTFQVNHT